MLIGVPKEIKDNKFRVGLVPSSIRELISHGHSVVAETQAGAGIEYTDADYRQAGAEIVDRAEDVFAQAEMLVKIKKPQAVERKMLRENQILFTYLHLAPLHLAPDPDQAKDLIELGATCIAYETVTSPTGSLPLLAPMSEVAGRMSVHAGAHCLKKSRRRARHVAGGGPGVRPANVAVLSREMVGPNAIFIALGMGANVAVLNRNIDVLRRLTDRFGPALKTVFALQDVVHEYAVWADLFIGAVLVPGAEAPTLVSEDMAREMKPGAAIVDVAIDQSGCIATLHATTHADPTYIEHDVVQYCVANMPGAVPHTSTYALNNETLPFTLAFADKGVRNAMQKDEHLRNGLDVHAGKLTYSAVAEALELDHTDALTALSAEC